ncbi:MAG: OB-fold domain-containing protein [Deltaproteobacteria bacterium]|nr:OB-fold domain-containing protein [Deltaproteobacteria bacterium]
MAEKKKVPIKQGLFHLPDSPGDQPYLIGSKCSHCGYVAFPKSWVCPSCMKDHTMEEISLSRRGKLDTFAVLRQAPSGFTAPYIIGYVILPEGTRIFTIITGTEIRDDALKRGQEVELVIDKLREDAQGNEIIGWKFKPV